MSELYRYKRGIGGDLEKSPAGDTAPRTGEMIALPGKKHRTYRAPVVLDANNKPVRTPLHKIRATQYKRRGRPDADPNLELNLELKAMDSLITELERLRET